MYHTVNTTEFDYDFNTNEFMADASDLKAAGNKGLVSMQDNFLLQSERTGNTALLVLHDIDRNEENEICAWVFKPVHDHHKGLFTLWIFND